MTDTQRAALAELDANIAQGEEFERQGYDCGMMLALTYALRDKLMQEVMGDVP